MNYREALLLFCLNQINGQRTINGLYHLLQGKKSSQTIQDGKLFGVSFLFGTCKHINRKEFLETVTRLHNERFIIKKSEDTFLVSEPGVKIMEGILRKYPFPDHLDGWAYQSRADLFWKRLSLYVQSLSHLLKGDSNFLPVNREDNIQYWIKKNFPMEQNEREAWANNLYNEILSLLNDLTENESTLFTYRLSGFHRVGLTINQAAGRIGVDSDFANLLFKGILHYIMKRLQENEQKYPFLSVFVKDLEVLLPLTDSARKTFSMLGKNRTIKEIAGYRRLKESTIEDHIVEIAMNVPEFTIDSFVAPFEQEEILEISKQLRTKRLKPIKTALEDRLSYFQIRLVLVKEG
ncbi:helix-turn-helix domain-containing protein [Pseudalkalibacillus caeni]|uniref:Recombinase RecQ n=1 Tax=Exobacillus caeni TaxID=2574798 RepID=A0A5R9EWK8_9BACL|nr:helix-turn-helix domain-containing protein [Pseudalkalibacillus caeni]TLS35622.1 recombinase RecQ [Pseudalkalibacillus caeni]